MAHDHVATYRSRSRQEIGQELCEICLLLQVRHLITFVIQGERIMSDALNEVNDAVGRVEGDVTNIKSFIATLNTQIADLQAQVAAGTPASVVDLAAVRDRLNALDTAFDAVAPDSAPVPDPAPPVA